MTIKFNLEPFPEFKRAFAEFAQEDPDAAAKPLAALRSFLNDPTSEGEFIRGSKQRSVYVLPRVRRWNDQSVIILYVDRNKVVDIKLHRSWSDDGPERKRLIAKAERWLGI